MVKSRDQVVKNLPNQIKSLLLNSINSNIVNQNFYSEESLNIDKFGVNSSDSSVFTLNYGLLANIEVLIKYSVDKDGNNLIQEPVWVLLSPELFKKSVGKNLLCRIKPYTNTIIGLKKDKGLELPVYNDYFILCPEIKIKEVAVKTTNILDKLINDLVNKNDKIIERKNYKTVETAVVRNLEATAAKTTNILDKLKDDLNIRNDKILERKNYKTVETAIIRKLE